MKLAIFDFDGTIYKYETYSALMQQLKKLNKKRYYQFYANISPVYLAYKGNLLSEKKMKDILMQQYVHAIRHMSEAEKETFFAIAAAEMEADLNLDVLQRIQEHKEDGFSTLIVSGAFTPLLQAFLPVAPVDQVIGTDLANKIDHIHAERKTEVVLEAFPDADIDWESSYAYGDSASDIALLELVGNPVAVHPDEKLAYTAKERKWEIIY